MYPLTLNPEGIVNLLDSRRLPSSCAIDCIDSKFLKKYKNVDLNIFREYTLSIIEQGILPDDWRVAKVVPAHKCARFH